MDNDFEIKSRIHSGIQDFLEQESRNLPSENAGTRYDLEHAYEATRKNSWKNNKPIVLLMLAAVLFVTVLSSVIVMIVNKKNSQIAVKVENFDDLNLRNLLDLVGSTQAKLDEETSTKLNLESEKERIMTQAQAARDSSLATVQSLNIKDATERNQRIKEIEDKYQADIQGIPEIERKIQQAQKNIDEYQKQLMEFDSNAVEQAREQQALLDSEKQLHEIEKSKIASEYENKLNELRSSLSEVQQSDLARQEEMVSFVVAQYDPTFEDDQTALSISRKARSQYDAKYSGSKTTVTAGASQEFLDALAGQSEYYAELEKLRTRFNRLPQKNAIPSFALALERIANSAGNDMAKAAVSEVNNLLDKNTKLTERNETLEGENQELVTKSEELTQNLNTVTQEKDTLAQEKETLVAQKEELTAETQSLKTQNNELTLENRNLSKERDSLSAERDALATEKQKLAGEKESLSTQVTTLSGQLKNATAEQEILSTRVKTLDSRTKDLTSQNDAYSQLLETLVSQSSSHGFVASVISTSKVQLFISKSKNSSLSSQYGGSNEIPVGVVSDGKIIACGKISKQSGSWYMVPVKVENQSAVNEWLTATEGLPVSADASFSKIRSGQSIVIGTPLFLGE
ncbi:MAG: hypothetical protein J6Y69_02985 [Treponema sp.]|nr:hypothetical protein [Treponema sp.]